MLSPPRAAPLSLVKAGTRPAVHTGSGPSSQECEVAREVTTQPGWHHAETATRMDDSDRRPCRDRHRSFDRAAHERKWRQRPEAANGRRRRSCAAVAAAIRSTGTDAAKAAAIRRGHAGAKARRSSCTGQAGRRRAIGTGARCRICADAASAHANGPICGSACRAEAGCRRHASGGRTRRCRT